MQRFVPHIFVLAAAAALTVVFWWPLWIGGGLIGGDVYFYYFPQKDFFADRLRAGEFPLWNNRTGHGYPLVGESQTAPFYPLNPLWYGLLSVNTAYNVNHLLHYVLAFVGTWMYSRRLGLAYAGALLSALVYTYGWFPPRCCLEWAIIGGAYLPLALWCVESFLLSGRWRHLSGLSVTLALQMLAGHFHLAFITQLLLAAYVPLRLRTLRANHPPADARGNWPRVLLPAGALLAGYALAAVQLLPAWELKQHSQRNGRNADFDPLYGHIPPLYLTQTFAPWWWYSSEVELDHALGRLTPFAVGAATNKVEAHLYFGLLPLVLAVWGWVAPRLRVAQETDPRMHMWLWLGAAFLILATGWPLLWLQHLPGFGYFRGTGRYGIVTTLAVGWVAGCTWDGITRSWRRGRAQLLTAALLGLTTADLWWVSRHVTYTFLLNPRFVRLHEASVLEPLLASSPEPVRLYAPGANLANMLGVAATPLYLGIGPREYFDPQLTMPAGPPATPEASYELTTPAQVEWLRRAGVTHVLSFKPLDPDLWPADEIWSGWDPFFSPALQRSLSEPLFLSRLRGSRGRTQFLDAQAGDVARVTEYAANRVVIETDSPRGGRLVLTDLMFADWFVEIDGQPARRLRIEGMYRGVDVPAGRHSVVWKYRPRSVYWGAGVSAAALLTLVAVAHVRSRHIRNRVWPHG